MGTVYVVTFKAFFNKNNTKYNFVAETKEKAIKEIEKVYGISPLVFKEAKGGICTMVAPSLIVHDDDEHPLPGNVYVIKRRMI